MRYFIPWEVWERQSWPAALNRTRRAGRQCPRQGVSQRCTLGSRREACLESLPGIGITAEPGECRSFSEPGALVIGILGDKGGETPSGLFEALLMQELVGHVKARRGIARIGLQGARVERHGLGMSAEAMEDTGKVEVSLGELAIVGQGGPVVIDCGEVITACRKKIADTQLGGGLL